jgi:DNA-directed RNA polymerase subunit RPC12/RpoP
MSTAESYEYTCKECGRIFKEKEAYHSIRTLYDEEGYKQTTELPVAACPKCYAVNCDCRLVKSGGAPHNA